MLQLFKIQLPIERITDNFVTGGLEVYLKTGFSKSLKCFQTENSILLNLPPETSGFLDNVQSFFELPSSGFLCHHRQLELHTLSAEEKEWFDSQIQKALELFHQFAPSDAKYPPEPCFHLLSIEKIR